MIVVLWCALPAPGYLLFMDLRGELSLLFFQALDGEIFCVLVSEHIFGPYIEDSISQFYWMLPRFCIMRNSEKLISIYLSMPLMSPLLFSLQVGES